MLYQQFRHELRASCGLKFESEFGLTPSSKSHELRASCGLKFWTANTKSAPTGHELRASCGLKFSPRGRERARYRVTSFALRVD